MSLIPKLPHDKYLALTGSVTESNAYNMDKFVDLLDYLGPRMKEGWNNIDYFNKIQYDMVRFMNRPELKGLVQFVGDGSARVAFFVKPGCLSEEQTAPCCLKLAKNKMGIAQNLAEESIFRTAGQLPCLPRMFRKDDKNHLYIITEVADELTDEVVKDYSKEWNSKLRTQMAKAYKLPEQEPQRYKAYNALRIDGDFCECMLTYTEENFGIYYPEAEFAKENVLKPIFKDNKRFQTLDGFVKFNDLEFASGDRGWSKMETGDWWSWANWGVVTRDGESIPLPIDWGFTQEVKQLYY